MTTEIRTGRTMRARRVGQAAALFIAPWLFVVANATDAWTTRRGGSDETAKGAIELAVAHPNLSKWASLAAMLGCLLLIPAVLGAMSLARERATRLSLIGGTLVVTGYVCYFGLVFQGFATIALAQHGGATLDNIAIQELITNQAFFVGPALAFVLGNIIGTFLLGLSLIRARAIPRWAGLAIMAWPILHIIGGSWGEVVGAIAEAVGLAVVGVRLLDVSSPDRVDDATGLADRHGPLDGHRTGKLNWRNHSLDDDETSSSAPSSYGARPASRVRPLRAGERPLGRDRIGSGPEEPGTRSGPPRRTAFPLLAVTAVLAAGAALTGGTAPATVSAPAQKARIDAADPIDAEPAGPDALLVAQLCLDARHVALVTNALRHDEPLTLGRVRGWCS